MDEHEYLPLVSCICPTFNRPPGHQHLLEEAIESFLRQTYPNKELIVLNDCPEQELVCDAPGVRVINASERFATLGEKRSAAIRLAHGDLIASWDDDDISLPWRLALSVEQLGDADYFNPHRYWFLDGEGWHFEHAMGVSHNASLFTRAAFEAAGGYPAVSGGEDQGLDHALRTQAAHVVDPNRGDAALSPTAWFYILRWGVSPTHLSSRFPHDDFYREIGNRAIRPGRFELHPHWSEDYVASTRAHLEKTQAVGAR